MTGTEAFHLRIESKQTSALEVCIHFLRACLLWTIFAISIFTLDGSCVHRVIAAEIGFPNASPYHTIHVRANMVARTVRGSYEVLAFRGQCQLRQGELTATCEDLILWVDRDRPSDPSQPGKFICTMEGGVQMSWDSKPLLQDSRWMGHLFSFQDISLQVLSEQNRNDIPRMDWSRESSSWVIPAQFAGPPANGTNNPNPPPLLPAPLPSPANNSSPLGGPLSSAVQPTPGATPWSPEGRISPNQLPVGGLEITGDGNVSSGGPGSGAGTATNGLSQYSAAQLCI